MGCSLNPPLDLAEVVPIGGSVELVGVPFHPQQSNHCGPASLLTVLEHSGAVADYASVVEWVYVPGLEGSLQVEMQAAARTFGRIAYTLPPEPEAVFEEIAAGRPVLVLLNLRTPSSPAWHYAVVVGFDPKRNRVVLRSGETARSRDRAAVWLRRWDWAGRWAMVALRPGEWPASENRDRLLRALAAFEETARPAEAQLAWQTAVKHWPEEPIAWLGLGNAAHDQEAWVAAIAAYRRALDLDPQRLAARINLASALGEDGRPCEGLEALNRSPIDGGSFVEARDALESRLRALCAQCLPR